MAEVHLTQQDIDYISRVVDTEVPRSLSFTNPAEYERMVQGVVDTITNRAASPQFPGSVTGILNQPAQFSKINGPPSLNPYGSVQNAPVGSPRAQAAVEDYVAARAVGAPATVGGAVNYANPNFSSPSALAGWVDPMISAGAMALGVGNQVHYHGVAPGMSPAGPYSLTAEGIPSTSVPTPQARPDTFNMQGSILQAIDPPTPAAVERAPLADVSPAPQDLGMQAGFDMSRFGPAPAAQPMAAPDFDMGRFGPTPTAAAFDTERFAPADAPVAQGMQGLQRGLLDQQLDVGILPNIPAPIAAPAPAAVPGYVDPVVTQANPVAPTPAAPAAPIGQTAAAPAAAAQPQRDFLGAKNPALNDMSMQTKGLLGTIGGALLGGALLGPVGGLLGGLLGKTTIGNPKDYYPSAPTPINGQSDPGHGFGSLSDYGKDVYGSSKDFHDAIDSGGVGLY